MDSQESSPTPQFESTNNLTYAEDVTLMAESEEELNNFLKGVR